ncbi:hypothetical protein PINS_up018343 [Pythium insidiosum]|nr:hypothetical protein PINS_up018343 [Pythium insidiosum]
MRPLLLLLLLVLQLLPMASSSSCRYHEGDAVVERLEARLPSCLPDVATAEELQDLVVTHELSGPRRPLAIAAFSSDSAALDALAASLGDAYFGSRRDGMRVVDVHEELRRGHTVDHHAVDDAAVLHAKQTLRHALSAALRQCPQRSLLVLRHVDALAGASLSTLDVLLDPLNGARGTLQDPSTGEELDSRGLVVLLLFHVMDDDDAATATKHSWREYLVQRWRDHGPVDEVFTPQAIVGRITGGVRVRQSTGTRASDLACRLLPLDARKDDVPAGVQWIFWAGLAVLALLVRAKAWVALRAALQKTSRSAETASLQKETQKQKQRRPEKQTPKMQATTENAADAASKDGVASNAQGSSVPESTPNTKTQTQTSTISKTSPTAKVKSDASSLAPSKQSEESQTSDPTPAPAATETVETETTETTTAPRPQRSTRASRAAAAMTSPRRQSPRRPRSGRSSSKRL